MAENYNNNILNNIPFLNCCYKNTLSAFLILLVFSCLVFLGGLGKVDLHNSDEPRVAGIAAEMARSGDLVVPRLNGTPFLEKPPLFFCAESAALKLFGENNFAARLIPALSATGCVLILFFLALSMNLSVRGAFLSGFILATSAEFWNLGRKNLIDMTLCFFIAASMLFFYKTIHSKSGKILWYIGFIVSLACAVLTKGLVGLAIPLSALFPWLIIKKDFSIGSWSKLCTGAILSIIPVSIWVLLLYKNLGRDAVYQAVWLNNFGRFTGSYEQHVGPFYYYFASFPVQFLPWSFFLPITGWLLIRDARKTDKSNPSLFILSWFVIPFILLSISSGKRGIYLLPLYPAAALAVGYCADLFLNGKEKSNAWFEIPSSILASIAVITPLVFLGIYLYYHRPFLGMIFVTIPGFVLGIFSMILLAKKDMGGFYKILVPSFLVIFLTFGMAITPVLYKNESLVPLFVYAKNLMSEGAQICLLQPNERVQGAAVFYLDQRIKKFDNFDSANEFIQKGNKIMIISEKENVEKIPDINIIKDFIVGNDTFVIVTDTKMVKEQ